MDKSSKIYVAGHKGLLGSSILRLLKSEGYGNLVFRESSELDLRNLQAAEEFFSREKPEYVFLAAAKVGGIKANMEHPADFLRWNLQIQDSVIGTADKFGVKKLIFFGSNCMYPKDAPQPFKEESILAGPPEPTNESYAIAKISGLKLCQAYQKQHGKRFISAIPASLFGPNDHFGSNDSHFVPSLITKLHHAKKSGLHSLEFWGTGKPRRELMYVEDAASAALFLMQNYGSLEPINVGIGQDYSIREIAEIACKIVGYEGELRFDSSKPDGLMKKMIDSSRINSLGWKSRFTLEQGLAETFRWFEAGFAV